MIDSHTHCFPPELFTNPNSWAIKHKESQWLNLVKPRNGFTIQAWSSVETTLTSMDNAGISKAILLGWYWEHKESCEKHNELMKEWIDFAPDRFVAFAAIDPSRAPIEQLELAKSLGFKGVGELHPTIQNYSRYKKQWNIICEWCSDASWPINLHVTEGLNKSHPGYIKTDFNIYLELAEKFPNLKMILAHCGGGIPFYECNPRIKTVFKNVYYDTAATPLLYNFKVFRHMIDMVGAEKIISGTDYPLKSFPKQNDSIQLKQFIDKINNETDLDDSEKDAIFSKNILKILHSQNP